MAKYVKWFLLSIAIAALSGTSSVLLLYALDGVTRLRELHPTLLLALPLAGFSVGYAYWKLGTSVERGMHLLIDEIHNPQSLIPKRIAPLIFISTVITHLFGGSAGREGTAVQMGAALADRLTRFFKISNEDRHILLMAGISAGFGSVFGTPLAGAVFGLEVIGLRRLKFKAIVPCIVASYGADFITRAWGPLLGVTHTHYVVDALPPFTTITILSVGFAGICFGLTAFAFSLTTHALQHQFRRFIKWPPLRPLIGGLIVVAGFEWLHSMRFAGLGIEQIVNSFSNQGGTLPYDFALKLLFTAITLSCGFKGGEVTPLFFIGATLGNTLALFLPVPTASLAAIGFVAVFAGAAQTPLASALMAFELFGLEIGGLALIACVIGNFFSGRNGIYHFTTHGVPKDLLLETRKVLL